MTLERISKEEMEYIKARDKSAHVTVTNRQHPKKKERYLEMTESSYKLLMECRKEQESRIIEKHGWFEESYVDGKTGQVKVKSVYYK